MKYSLSELKIPLLQAIKNIPKGVTELNLSRNNLDEITISELVEAFKALPETVIALDLTDNYFHRKPNRAKAYRLYNEVKSPVSVRLLQKVQDNSKALIVKEIDHLLESPEVNRHPEWKTRLSNRLLAIFKSMPIISLFLKSKQAQESPATERVRTIKDQLKGIQSNAQNVSESAPTFKR